MGDIFCSIGEDNIVADHRAKGNHSLQFLDKGFSDREELYSIFENQLLGRSEEVGAIYMTSPSQAAYLIRTEDVALFQQKNGQEFLYRCFPRDEQLSVIYKLPQHDIGLISSFGKAVYYIPLLEVFKRNIENYMPASEGEHKLYTFLIGSYLHTYLYSEGKNKVATVFECENPEDALYYSMLIIKEHGLRSEQVTCIPAGRGSMFKEALRLWTKYLHERTAYFQTEDQKKYFDLKGLVKCVS